MNGWRYISLRLGKAWINSNKNFFLDEAWNFSEKVVSSIEGLCSRFSRETIAKIIISDEEYTLRFVKSTESDTINYFLESTVSPFSVEIRYFVSSEIHQTMTWTLGEFREIFWFKWPVNISLGINDTDKSLDWQIARLFDDSRNKWTQKPLDMTESIVYSIFRDFFSWKSNIKKDDAYKSLSLKFWEGKNFYKAFFSDEDLTQEERAFLIWILEKANEELTFSIQNSWDSVVKANLLNWNTQLIQHLPWYKTPYFTPITVENQRLLIDSMELFKDVFVWFWWEYPKEWERTINFHGTCLDILSLENKDLEKFIKAFWKDDYRDSLLDLNCEWFFPDRIEKEAMTFLEWISTLEELKDALCLVDKDSINKILTSFWNLDKESVFVLFNNLRSFYFHKLQEKRVNIERMLESILEDWRTFDDIKDELAKFDLDSKKAQTQKKPISVSESDFAHYKKAFADSMKIMYDISKNKLFDEYLSLKAQALEDSDEHATLAVSNQRSYLENFYENLITFWDNWLSKEDVSFTSMKFIKTFFDAINYFWLDNSRQILEAFSKYFNSLNPINKWK